MQCIDYIDIILKEWHLRMRDFLIWSQTHVGYYWLRKVCLRSQMGSELLWNPSGIRPQHSRVTIDDHAFLTMSHYLYTEQPQGMEDNYIYISPRRAATTNFWLLTKLTNIVLQMHILTHRIWCSYVCSPIDRKRGTGLPKHCHTLFTVVINNDLQYGFNITSSNENVYHPIMLFD